MQRSRWVGGGEGVDITRACLRTRRRRPWGWGFRAPDDRRGRGVRSTPVARAVRVRATGFAVGTPTTGRPAGVRTPFERARGGRQGGADEYNRQGQETSAYPSHAMGATRCVHDPLTFPGPHRRRAGAIGPEGDVSQFWGQSCGRDPSGFFHTGSRGWHSVTTRLPTPAKVRPHDHGTTQPQLTPPAVGPPCGRAGVSMTCSMARPCSSKDVGTTTRVEPQGVSARVVHVQRIIRSGPERSPDRPCQSTAVKPRAPRRIQEARSWKERLWLPSGDTMSCPVSFCPQWLPSPTRMRKGVPGFSR